MAPTPPYRSGEYYLPGEVLRVPFRPSPDGMYVEHRCTVLRQHHDPELGRFVTTVVLPDGTTYPLT